MFASLILQKITKAQRREPFSAASSWLSAQFTIRRSTESVSVASNFFGLALLGVSFAVCLKCLPPRAAYHFWPASHVQ